MRARAVVVAVAVVGACLAWRACGRAAAPPASGPAASARTGRALALTARASDPRTRTRAAISGVVRDPARAPIAHAQVCADMWTNDVPLADSREPTCVETDAAGRYRIGDLIPTDTYTAVASARQFVPVEHAEFALAAGETRRDVDFVLARGGGELTGVVSSVTGETIAGAHVRAWRGERQFSGPLTVADEHGRFALWVGPGQLTAGATAEGYTETTVDARAPGTVALVLSPESSISGMVVDAGTHLPVEGVHVALLQEDGNWASEQFDVSDAQGAFRIARLTPLHYVVEAIAAHGRGRSRSLAVGFGQHIDGVVIELARAQRVEGRVVTAGDDKRGCPGAAVTLVDDAHGRALEAEGGSDGALHVDGVPPGTYRVIVMCRHADAVGPTSIVVADHDVSDLVWEAPRAATVRGTVRTRTGAAFAGAVVMAYASQANGANATSGADGAYELTELAADSYTLTVSSDGSRRGGHEVELDVTAGATLQQDLTLDDGLGSIAGRLVDERGAPVVGFVRVTDGQDNTSTYECAPDGTFATEPIAADSYTVAASGDRAWTKPAKRAVAVRDGETSRVELAVARPSGVIRGVVLEADGRPAVGVWVGARTEVGVDEGDLESEAWWGDGAPLVATTSTGAFELAGLGAGKHTLRAFRDGGGEAVAREVAVGASVTLRFQPPSSIAGVVRRSDGAALTDYVVIVDGEHEDTRRERFERSDGRFDITNLAADHYGVRVETGAGDQQKTLAIELAAGESRTGLEIVLAPLPALTGRVVAAGTHAPIAGISVLVLGCRMKVCGQGDVTSDAAGRFTVDHVERVELSLIVNVRRGAQGFGRRMIDVTPDDRSTFDVGDIELQPADPPDLPDLPDLPDPPDP